MPTLMQKLNENMHADTMQESATSQKSGAEEPSCAAWPAGPLLPGPPLPTISQPPSPLTGPDLNAASGEHVTCIYMLQLHGIMGKALLL
jgi:hypothetical protein